MTATTQNIPRNTRNNTRTITRVVEGIPVSDGAGVRLRRIIGTSQLPNLDPFLMFDEFRSDSAQDYVAGFPNHPHRGFQTVSYMLEGQMRHRDNQGHAGLLRAGGVQWMNAGRGIIHSEMPEQENGLLWGFQLWVNLPATEKMSAPAYQEFDPERIPLTDLGDGVTAKIIAGKTDSGVPGAVQAIVTQPLFFDVRMASPDSLFSQEIPATHTAFVYVYTGEISIAGTTLQRGQLALLENGERIEAQSLSNDSRFLLVAGAPIGEPIVQRGPFVMNTWEEIQQAVDDFSNGRFA